MAEGAIRITLPDGSNREVPRGTTPAEIARQISPRLAKEALVARVRRNGDAELVDLSRPLEEDVRLEILTPKDPDALQVLRHSCAHLLAAAVLELFPETKLGIGPPIENGFYYDFVRSEPFTAEDLGRIEARMRELAAKQIPNVRRLLPRAEALKLYTDWPQEFKCELIEEKAAGEPMVSFYQSGNFIDFCLGPHIPHWGMLKAFKLMNVAGAYWKGQEGNPQMQRIYGACFYTEDELQDYLHRLEEAKRRDHRRLGPELDLFSIQDEAGPGLIFWHPKGGLVRKLMEDWSREEHLRRGYQLVYTPHVMRLDLWETSGHTNFYRENMFGAMEVEKAEYQLKPMNCPGHILIYKSRLRSYRELPLRLAELGTVYRYERSGVLHGLLRVRGFTQDDAHIFCMPEQLESEIEAAVDFALAVLRTFGFEKFEVELSARDPQRPADYAGTEEEWERAEAALRNSLARMELPYKYMPGEAVFYGPKIDMKLLDAIGRPWQLSTVQFDFNLPRRFGIEYVGEDGARHQPVMVHRALWGSVERFFGVLIEHFAGAFPVWLAPVQAVVLPISEKFAGYAAKVAERLREAGFRAELDNRNEKVQARIRDAQLAKIPYMLVVGAREEASGAVSVRHRSGGDLGPRPLEDFLAGLRQEVDSRAVM
jgi:threonyl-tRNA synthetase